MTAGLRTLGQLAQTAGLARSSLLHYEKMRLLVPAARSAAGYRLYGESEIARLRAIRRFREAGLSLGEVAELLSIRHVPRVGAGTGPAALLENRLVDLSREIKRLRRQQMMLARLLASPEFRTVMKSKGKATWVALLRGAGFSDKEMRQWHAEFEAESPAKHAQFLCSLGLARTEVVAIQRWSKTASASLP